MKISIRWLSACLITLSTLNALTQGRSSLTLAPLIAGSDLIVVGTISFDPSASSRTLGIVPIRVLQGSPPAGSAILVSRSQPVTESCPGNPPTKPMTAIWFLKLQEDNIYSFVSGSLADPCFLEYTYFEVEAALDDAFLPSVSLQSTADRIAIELAAEAWQTKGEAPMAVVRTQSVLRDASLPIRTAIYSRWENSDTDRLRMMAFVGLVSTGDTQAIQSIADGRQDYRQIKLPSQAKLNGSSYQTQINVLGFVTYEGAVAEALGNVSYPAPGAILALGAVTRNLDLSIEVRSAAARALRQWHDQQAAKQLTPLLTSDKAELRAEALVGISQYAFGFPPWDSSDLPGSTKALHHYSPRSQPGLDITRAIHGTPMVTSENEKGYLQFWSAWSKASLSGSTDLNP